MTSGKKPVLFSGIQPSGNLTIGNYIGALSNWVDMQENYDSLFVLVDLHAITVYQDPDILRRRCLDFLALYLASGLDPQKSTIFVQSHVPAHAELAWVLNCVAYMGELSRMTQFKDKSKKSGANIGVGLFDYPVLMAADILLYGTSVVPVGADQKQHVEIARDLAIRFNRLYGDTFVLPEPVIPRVGARVMNLLDPAKKMSKSDENPRTYIALLDSPDAIRSKLKKAVTDTLGVVRADPERPGISNLLTMFSVLARRPISAIEEEYDGAGYGKFKADLAELIVETLRPIQERYSRIIDDQDGLMAVLDRGAEAARDRSRRTMEEVYEKVGCFGHKR